MAEYRLSHNVYADLDAIADYISEDDPDRAVSFIDELVARFEVIAERPLSFPESNDLPPAVRSALHGNYRILFEMIEDLPHILRVVHGARDISSIMDND